MTRRGVWAPALAVCAALLTASVVAAGDTQAAGRALYLRYCSACHGQTATGDGLVGQLITPRPIDLTLLAERNGGTFPTEAVVESIDGRHTVRAHGVPDMPVWGEILSRDPDPARGGDIVARTKIVCIATYLESLQRR